MLNPNKKDNIIFLVIYLHKLIDKDFDAKASSLGITGQQARILLYINRMKNCEQKDIHQNDIENEFHLSKSTVSGLVKRLEAKELITITKQHPYAIVELSERGKDIICHLIEHRKENIDQLTKGLDEKDKKVACEYLVKLIENMEGGSE